MSLTKIIRRRKEEDHFERLRFLDLERISLCMVSMYCFMYRRKDKELLQSMGGTS